MKNALKTFNKPDTTIVITSFPNPKDDTSGNKGFNAVAWHSQKTLVELSKHAPVLVLAEIRGQQIQKTQKPRKTSNSENLNIRQSDKSDILSSPSILKINDNLTVQRVWEKGNIFSILALFQLIRKLHKVQSIFIQFEFNVFGGILPNLMLLLLIALLRLAGKRVTFELHQVITDVGLLKKHVPIKNKLIQMGYNAGLVVFYRVLGVVANTIVVFEETLKSRLSQFVHTDKIEVLCLSVEKKQTLSKASARRKLKLDPNDFTVLVFGFINGYKGIDWIVNALKDTPVIARNIVTKQSHKRDRHAFARDDKNLRLLVAGGQNPYLKDQPHYQKLYNSIVGEIKKHKHMTYRDFVPDNLVTTYFSAADVVVLPYEVFMSASGPFSLALSYGKPVLLSEKLLPYAESSDVQESITHAGLTQTDIFFKLTKTDLKKKLSRLQSKSEISKLASFSNMLADARASENVVLRLHAILHAPSTISVPVARLPRLDRGLQSPSASESIS